GTTLVSAGALVVNGSQSTSAVTVNTGATLNGTGTTGPVTTSGTVSPGVGGPGILNTGNAVFSTGSTFMVALNGITAGTGYGQLNVTGTVALSGSPTLNVSVGFSSVVNDTFMIIVSTGNITGTFNGLADNSTFVASGMAFRIKYNTNNVVLTR